MNTKLKNFFPCLVASLLVAAPAVFAADEICGSCGNEVGVNGDFSHRKDNPALAIEGAGENAAAFREDINGKNFTVTIAHLPAGKYTVVIGAAETTASAPGERVFDVSAGDVSLAKNLDLIAAAGGARKVCYVTNAVEHEDDSLRGPLKIAFTASKGTAKFNTFEVRNATGATVVAFQASELADAYTAAAMRVPQVDEPAIWRDSSRPLKARAEDLIRRMSLAEKVAQLKNAAPAIQRLGLPAYDYWNEALHGVANNGNATVFPEPVGAAASWNPGLFHQEGTIIGIEGRAKFNDYANKHNGDSKWWTGMTFWTPNINIFRDPRWGRGQETYGEDPYLTSEIGIEFVKGIQGDDPNYMLAMACAKHYAV
ncbi:MAG TPA: glycoside hydrolase family 3 N-terminal domain-containing protein, partial [Candidatus Paceibacterota bacterium]|nr:glycoside hydrolase family 3 N-terminal domain-containing protein [Candidatus Paceibacterota bacterium]